MTTKSAKFRSKPYIDAEYDEGWTRIGRLLRNAGFRCTVIPFCPLSTFFDFKAFDTGAFTDSEKDAVKYGHLAFACVDIEVASKPKLVAAIVRSSDDKYSTGALRALRTKLGIEPIIWGESETAHRLALTVQSRIDEGITPIDLPKCPAIWWGEKQTAILIQKALWLNRPRDVRVWKDALAQAPEESKADVQFVIEELKEKVAQARKDYWFWREAPLRLFIECTPADLTRSEASLRDLWWITSADLLVTTRAPDYEPVLAVEFDGPHHDSEKQKATDAKRDEIFRRAGLPLLRVRSNDLNGSDPLTGPRAEAAVRLIVERRALERSDEVRRLNAGMFRILRLAIGRAKARGEFVLGNFQVDKYLTADEESERFDLGLELHQVMGDNEQWNVQQSEGDAERYSGIRVVFDSVEVGEFGHVASVHCSELDGTPLGKITGDCIRLTGPESSELSYAERQIAIGAAFDLAQRTFGKH